MLARFSFIWFLFVALHANGQEDVIDSSLWELVVPLEISINKKEVSNVISLSRNDFVTKAASFDDPSRLLMNYAGFSNLNDQNNGVIYHGMPSHFTGWFVNDAEILNPNHLSNAGISGTKLSTNAGGVNAFSGQILGEYTFRANPNIDTNNDYLAGVSNMTFRTPYRNQITMNTSLLGLETGFDMKEKNVSLVGNYRYSTVGILTDLGLDFGGEEIKYQDAFVNLKMTDDLLEFDLELFMMYGNSSNYKERGSPIESIEDYMQIDLISDLYIGGVNITKETDQLLFESATNYSLLDHKFYSKLADNQNIMNNHKLVSNNTSLSILGSSSQLAINLNSKYSFRTDYNNSSNPSLTDNKLFQPNLFYKTNIDNRLFLDFGLGSSHFLNNGRTENAFNPKIGCTWIGNDYRHKLSFKYNYTRQFTNLTSYYFQSGQEFFPLAHNISLALSDNKFPISAEVFFHAINGLSQDAFGISSFSSLDELGFQSFDFTLFDNRSSAKIYGVSISFEEAVNDISKISGNITLTRGKQKMIVPGFVTGPSDIVSYMNIPQLAGIACNFNYTKKQFLTKKCDLNFSVHFREGNKVRFTFNDPFNRPLPYYFRSDLRINYHFNKVARRYKSMLSLDIQNLTNRLNGIRYYFDNFIGEEVLDTQLGIIPVLSWRVVI